MIELGEVNEENLTAVAEKMVERIQAGDRQLVLRLNSPGGSVFDGLSFIQWVEGVKQSTKVRVTCVVDVMAASMAFVILQSPVCDERLMTRRSILLAHEASTSVSGKPADLESALEMLRAISRALGAVCANRMGMSVDEFMARIANVDWSMDADAALKAHAVDGLVDPATLPPVFAP